MAQQSTLKRLWSLLVGVVLTASAGLATEASDQPRCEYRGPSETLGGAGWHWSYTVGTKLTGSNRVNFSGMAPPEGERSCPERQEDTAFNPATKRQSEKQHSWFSDP